MTIKTLAALATALIASSAFAGSAPDKKCGAGSCSKKTATARAASGAASDASCSKKEASCSKKDTTHDAGCSKKEAKDAGCSKKASGADKQ